MEEDALVIDSLPCLEVVELLRELRQRHGGELQLRQDRCAGVRNHRAKQVRENHAALQGRADDRRTLGLLAGLHLPRLHVSQVLVAVVRRGNGSVNGVVKLVVLHVLFHLVDDMPQVERTISRHVRDL